MGDSTLQRSLQPPNLRGEMPLRDLRQDRHGILSNHDAGAQKRVSGKNVELGSDPRSFEKNYRMEGKYDRKILEGKND